MKIKFDDKGLIAVVTQDHETGKVLMLAYMNLEAYEKTLKEKKLYYFSRSRQTLWLKGESSGNTQKLISLTLDCDGDSLLARVIQKGSACHTNKKSCFYNTVIDGTLGFEILADIMTTIEERIDEPLEGSYTNYLWQEGKDKILKKIGEEASEIIIASKNNSKEELTNEISDFIYHLFVLMKFDGVKSQEIFKILNERK